MIVVADTRPLNYLILIDCVHVLEPMYGRVAIPEAVRAEMLRPQTPDAVRAWVNRLPTWVEVHSPTPPAKFLAPNLGLGESQAISLALALKAPVIVIDEIVGRKEAQAHGLRVIGTLGILRDAQELNLLDLKTAIERLKATNFRIPSEVVAKLLGQE